MTCTSIMQHKLLENRHNSKICTSLMKTCSTSNCHSIYVHVYFAHAIIFEMLSATYTIVSIHNYATLIIKLSLKCGY